MPITRKIKPLLERLQKAEPTVRYGLSMSPYDLKLHDAGRGDYFLTEDEYRAIKPIREFCFGVHGFLCSLTANELAIGCTTHPLAGWNEEITRRRIVEEQFRQGNFVYPRPGHGDKDKAVALVKAQWKEAYPIFKKLQAKLVDKPKAVKKKKAAKKKARR